MSPLLIGLVCLGLILLILPNLWAIWHAFHSEFSTAEEKMSWISAAVFIPVLGGLLYLFLGRRRTQ